MPKTLTIINLKSGQNNSLKIYNNLVKPKLLENNLFIIDCKNNLIDINYIKNYDSLIIIGGDGSVNSIVNLILKNNLNLTLSVIPGGTGNGLCKSILHLKKIDYNIKNAVNEIFNNNKQKINLFEVKKENNTITYGFLSITWGLFSNIDIKTEWLRKLGTLRNTLGAIWELIRKYEYYGTFKYLDDNDNWITIIDHFNYFTVSNLSHVCHDIFLESDAKPDDGYLYIGYLLSNTSRINILKFLLSLDNNGLCKKYLNNIRTKHFILEPKDGMLVLDGEKIKLQRIEVKTSDKSITII